MSNAARSERSPARRRRGWSAIAEWVLLAIVAILIAFVVQRFFFQAFYIPSRSMEPTLSVGDRVLVNKLSYRLHDVRRGDLVVFEAPDGERTAEIADFVKRVIALPGETIEWREEGDEHHVYIDGQRLEEPYLPPDSAGQTTVNGPPPGCDATSETPFVSCTVPAGSVLVMGDNRTQSKDGREFGPVSEDKIVGRVFLHIWPPTLTWVAIGAVVAALVVAFFALRALIRGLRHRSRSPDDGGAPGDGDGRGRTVGPDGLVDPDGTAHAEPTASTTSTINRTRSE